MNHPDMETFNAFIEASKASKTKRRQAPSLQVEDVSLSYPAEPNALQNISLEIPSGCVTAVIGPSGCGKSTLLRCFNRMNDTINGCRYSGSIFLDGANILSEGIDVTTLRRKVCMVFQRPNPFPKSVYDNVAYGPRLGGIRSRRQLDEIVENALRAAALWDEVKDRLDAMAATLSLGQQQRLVIARAIAVEPEVLLLDEPASSLDPISTLRIKELIYELKTDYTIIIVTHNMQQAARVSQRTAYFHLGKLVEVGETEQMFTTPQHEMTQNYITGRFG